jgi:hypothetical protein
MFIRHLRGRQDFSLLKINKLSLRGVMQSPYPQEVKDFIIKLKFPDAKSLELNRFPNIQDFPILA